MTRILEKLGGTDRGRDVRKDLHLEFVRFRKLLEKMREVFRLFADARDKLKEEYIFDRHYILSLVDAVLEESSLLAFNASVLSPASGKEFYSRLDVHRKFAQEEFLEPDTIRMDSFSIPSTYRDADQETRMLAAVLNWLAGPLPENRPVVLDFIGYVTDAVIANCRKEELIKKADPFSRSVKLGGDGALMLIDVGGNLPSTSEEAVVPEDIQCRPFGLLLAGLLDGRASEGISTKESGKDRWILFDEEQISFRISRNNTKIHLEASLYGDAATDFVFMYSQNPFDLRSICPQGFRVEKTGQGTLAWTYDVPTDQLEKHIIQLGTALLHRT